MEIVEEKKHVGKFDLPQSIGFIISRLVQQKFPLEGDKPHTKPIYHAFYELREILQDNENVTERYKKGGDLTESKICRTSE